MTLGLSKEFQNRTESINQKEMIVKLNCLFIRRHHQESEKTIHRSREAICNA